LVLRLAVLLVCMLGADPALAGPRLDAIKSRGTLNCAVAQTEGGMGLRGPDGIFSGFEADLCRAVAITLFGAPKVNFLTLDTVPQFLASDADIAMRRLTWTFSREAGADLRFGPIVLYDGQTFLVKAEAGIANADALSGRRMCVSTDAAFVANLKRFFGARGLALNIFTFAARQEAEAAFFAGECDAFSADATELASALHARPALSSAYRILPERISKEPLAPLLRKGDDAFFDVVRWSILGLIAAEELGITPENLEAKRKDKDALLRGFFEAPNPEGFTPDWPALLVYQLGNYGLLYERHLGRNAPSRLERGANALAPFGGLIFAPPFH
jgi:general L-amino acid transport system substrate-binding protein